MEGQQWEYCRLWIYGSQGVSKGLFGSDPNLYGYACDILYVSTGSSKGDSYALARLDKPLNFNPFLRAIGLLGAAGWELVSIQHGTNNSIGGEYEGSIIWDKCIAYFKRPSIPGRPVSEPKLSI
jgi:hypothetical protein